MMQIEAAVSRADVESLISMMGLSKEAAQRAARRAVAKTAKWTQSQAARAMSAELRVQQRILRARLRLYKRGDGMEQKIWLGLNAITANRLGTPRKKSGGTQVGRHFFKDAFPIKRYGGGVYRRKGRERFPLELARLGIDAIGALALREAAQRADDRLLEILQQELRYEFSKVMK
ncbi:MAG: phage tail protein [Porticoccaceae bacterium]